MRRPTDQQIEIACLWLEANEGESEEQQACRSVAAWLEHQAAERMLRQEAKSAGVPVTAVRRRLAEAKGKP